MELLILVLATLGAVLGKKQSNFLSLYILKKSSFLGVPNGERIIGGDVASPGQFPSIVSITKENQEICMGSIINKKWVLTAGHCIVEFSENAVIRAGS